MAMRLYIYGDFEGGYSDERNDCAMWVENGDKETWSL